MMSKIMLAFYILTTVAGLIVLKLGANKELPLGGGGRLPFGLNYYTLAGICLYGVSFISYVYLISKYDLGYIIPVAGAFVWILVFSASMD